MATRFKDYFSGHAADYAKHRPQYPDQLFDWLASLVPERRQAWDCATGNGQAACALATRFDGVTATDASQQQIDCAIPHPHVTYRAAPAEASGIPAQTINLVTVAQAVHWFDHEKFYREVRRVAAPHGVLAVWCYGLFHISPAIDGLLREFYSDVVGPYWPPERRWVEEGYRSLPFPFEAVTPPSCEMTVTWSLPAVLDYLGTWSATQRYLQERGADPREQIRGALTRAWGDAGQPKPIVWPLHLRVGRVG